ncbi:unnamed protein product [Acanthoscelides obtectus]|nr:unnamed protein product [Acanthoscelides obtectus]CAK1627992.1 hypothetical protein AOBTE_LOCUS4946 [Acanthoscelides obtectus]
MDSLIPGVTIKFPANVLRVAERNEYHSDSTNFQRKKEPLQKSTSHGVQHKLSQNASQQMKSFASEPDLRLTSLNKQMMKERRSKKKYKAPSPPNRTASKEKPLTEWEDNSSDNEYSVRRPRLYKTRAETKKSSHVIKSSPGSQDGSNRLPSTVPTAPNHRPNRLSLPEMKFADTEEFQNELREATKRLRHISVESQTIMKFDLTKAGNKANAQESSKADSKNVNCIRGEASGKESSSQEASPKLPQKANKPEQSKFFYFGMEERGNGDITTYRTPQVIRASSDSDISTDIDSDENNGKVKINLQLRPILPKKQLEIPRFSPADAWKLLSTIEAATDITVASDDASLFVEESIEKYSRPPPTLMHMGPRSSHDKSGDSGISGDDAIQLAGFDDPMEHHGVIKQIQVPYKKQERISWTPQQDLEDDSSIEECLNSKVLDQRPKAGPHLFSLSLPRDNHLASYMIEKTHQTNYSGLERFKKSLTGVLNHITPKKDVLQASLTDEDSVNWFLSKSTANSLSNGFHSLEMKRSDDYGKSSRIMYLPEINNNIYNVSKQHHKPPVHSKSVENIHVETRESLQDPIVENVWKEKKKSKKFTFQSTIRQLEKRNLSEKLAKEAEKREQKRLMELEAMRKVEEEFQRKRDREKANIKQQLRSYRTDEDTAWSSLPSNLEMQNKVRAEPDGAISSSPSPQASFEKLLDNFGGFKVAQSRSHVNKVKATQELSEFKQTEYSYKEYRLKKRYYNEGHSIRQTTVHPQVTCHMPKAKEYGKMTTGKKDVACGVDSTMSVSSSYSEDSHHYGKYGPITR